MPINAQDLAHYTCSDQFYVSNGFTGKRLVHSEGIEYVVQMGEARWLLDVIASHYRSVAQWTVNCDGFATIIFRKNKTGNGAKLRMGDGNGTEKTLQAIPYTDFPFDGVGGTEFKMYVRYNENRLTMILPREN